MILFINNCHSQSSIPSFVIMFTIALSTMYGIWTVFYRTGVTRRPGKTLSDVNIWELVLVVLNIYNTVHNYNIMKSGTITGKAAILEPQNETNIWVDATQVDATQKHTWHNNNNLTTLFVQPILFLIRKY